MNERFSQIIFSSWKLKCHAPRRILRRSMVIEDEDNYSTSRKVRPWRILLQVIKHEFCYFSERCIHSACRYRSIVRWRFTTNKSNKVEGTVINLEKAGISKDWLNMIVLSIFLNNSMNPTSLEVSGKWFHKLWHPIKKEYFACVFVCMPVCVCVHVHIIVCVYAHAFCFS